MDAAEQARIDKQQAEDEARLRAPGARAAAALWYAKHGVHVFPVEERGKQPRVKAWPEQASTDPDQIRLWWSRGDFNIGAPTGRLFDVIDIDGPVGYRSWVDEADNLIRSGLVELARVWTGGSARHGTHLFVKPSGLTNGAGWLPGVDYRGEGGYVILPPSIGASGRLYQWADPPAFLTGGPPAEPRGERLLETDPDLTLMEVK